MPRPGKQKPRGKGRVGQLRTLDRGFPSPRPSRPTTERGGFQTPRPGARPTTEGGGFQTPRTGGFAPAPGSVASTPQLRQPGEHPFLPGQNLHPVVPANLSESGSAPGTPNLAAMVMRSFQPQVLERTPLVSSGAGVPASPNARFNFGGQNTAPPGVGSMVPQRQQQGAY